jgi:hypothetical protein
VCVADDTGQFQLQDAVEKLDRFRLVQLLHRSLLRHRARSKGVRALTLTRALGSAPIRRGSGTAHAFAAEPLTVGRSVEDTLDAQPHCFHVGGDRSAFQHFVVAWPRILNRYARLVVPQPDDVLHGCQ